MQHKPDITRLTDRQTNINENMSRKDRHQDVVDRVKEACKKLGGHAIIGDGYVIVDTSKYTVSEK